MAQVLTQKVIKKHYSQPDETRKFEKGQVDVINIEGHVLGRATFQPGWKWSTHVKPMANTRYCEASHLGYQISGRLHVVMEDGSEHEFGPGDFSFIPSGHDAWVVGDEPVVIIDMTGMKDYAKKR